MKQGAGATRCIYSFSSHNKRSIKIRVAEVPVEKEALTILKQIAREQNYCAIRPVLLLSPADTVIQYCPAYVTLYSTVYRPEGSPSVAYA
jgi:hypothetical protein